MRTASRLLAAASVLALFAGEASADPLYFLNLEASTTASGPYSSSLQVQANTTYYYEITLSPNAIGTHNANGGTGGSMITAIGAGDGANSVSFNINDTVGSTIPVGFGLPTLQNSYNNALSASSGAQDADGDGITGIRGGQAAGVYPGANVVILTGTFMAGSILSAGLSSYVNLSYADVTSGVRINDGAKTVIVSTVTELGADPVMGYNGLTLFTPGVAVPVPPSLLMTGLGFSGMASFRFARRRKS